MTAINSKIDTWSKAGEKNQLDGHKIVVAIATEWNKTGDIRPAVLAVNYMLTKMPASQRTNAFKAYVEKFFGFVFNSETKAFVGGRTKGKSLDVKLITNTKWYEFTKEAEYVPITDFVKLMAQLVARAEKDVAALGDKSVVDATKLAALKALVA